jgi:hypothetical protein
MDKNKMEEVYQKIFEKDIEDAKIVFRKIRENFSSLRAQDETLMGLCLIYVRQLKHHKSEDHLE